MKIIHNYLLTFSQHCKIYTFGTLFLKQKVYLTYRMFSWYRKIEKAQQLTAALIKKFGLSCCHEENRDTNKDSFIFLKYYWSPPVEQPVQFINSMSDKGLVNSIARTYTSGIAYYLKLYNCKDVTQKNFLVKRLLESFKRKSKSKTNKVIDN